MANTTAQNQRFSRLFSFCLGIDAVKNGLESVLEEHRFRVKQEKSSQKGIHIEAIYGSKVLALIIGLIPLVGRDLPWGKRFLLTADLAVDGNKTNLLLVIVPYMELLDEIEILGPTQDDVEKLTDEYFASRKLDSITRDLMSRLQATS